MLHHVVTLSRLLWSGAFAAVAGVTIRGGRAALAPVVLLAGLALLEEASDAFDGVLARRAGKASQLGGILDPMADSLGRATIYFALALTGCITIAVPLVMVGRDIIVAYCRIWSAIKGASTSARLSGKVKAIVQGGGIFAIILLAWLATAAEPAAIQAWRIAVAAVLIVVTAWSLLDYVLGAARVATCPPETSGSPRT